MILFTDNELLVLQTRNKWTTTGISKAFNIEYRDAEILIRAAILDGALLPTEEVGMFIVSKPDTVAMEEAINKQLAGSFDNDMIITMAKWSYWSTSSMEDKFNISTTEALQILNRMHDAGLVKKTNKHNPKTWKVLSAMHDMVDGINTTKRKESTRAALVKDQFNKWYESFANANAHPFMQHVNSVLHSYALLINKYSKNHINADEYDVDNITNHGITFTADRGTTIRLTRDYFTNMQPTLDLLKIQLIEDQERDEAIRVLMAHQKELADAPKDINNLKALIQKYPTIANNILDEIKLASI